MLDTLSFLVVAAAGVYFVVLSIASFAAPSRAASFLMGFASSFGAHLAELLARIAAGVGFVHQAAHVAFPAAFAAFGWLLIGTSAVLLAIPWRWHRTFAQCAVPQALRYLPLVALASLMMGGYVLWSVVARAF